LTKLTLLTRACCHLCDEMEEALRPLSIEFGIGVARIDVDADAELRTRYDELVPVLLHEGRELCHYFLEEAKVRDYLSKIR
jgi:hypothetical protein